MVTQPIGITTGIIPIYLLNDESKAHGQLCFHNDFVKIQEFLEMKTNPKVSWNIIQNKHNSIATEPIFLDFSFTVEL